MNAFEPQHADLGTIGLADLPLFLAVARHRSFVAAARTTGTPPSTVSRAVARLEERLGVRLFHRTSRTVALTPEGALLAERTGSLAHELAEALQGVGGRGAPAGPLRVTVPVVSGEGRLGRALVAFAARHPRVRVELHLSNSVLDLVEEGFDLGFRVGPLPDSDLVARRLWTVSYVLAASPAFVRRALHGRRRLERSRLEASPAILTAGRTWRFEGADGRAEEVEPRACFRVNHPGVAAHAAAQGLGIACLPVDAIAGSGLVTLSTDVGSVPSRGMYAVFPSRRLVPARVRCAVDWVAAWNDRGPDRDLRGRRASSTTRPDE